VNIELSVEELELVCDGLDLKRSFLIEVLEITGSTGVGKKLHECANLEDRLRDRLRDEYALTDMPFEEEAE
jgi:hypothetical protein